MKDIQSREDVEKLINTFYGKVREHEVLGPIFNGRIGDQWPVHLEKMYNFWESTLFGKGLYRGRPFPPHATLGISKPHFDHWLTLFYATVDELFQGEVAENAKKSSNRIAEVFLSKLNFFNQSIKDIPSKEN